MASLNKPVDAMFRAGQISSKEWKRLSMSANGKGGKTHGRMANFDAKTKDEGGRGENRAVSSTKRGHIDGPDQGMRGRGAVRPPTRGGGVQNNKGAEITNEEIDQAAHQKPDFPRQGSGTRPRQRMGNQQPSSSHPSSVKGDRNYGDKARRPNAPSRLGRAETRGGSF